MKKKSESCSVMSNSLQPHNIVHGILQTRILEWVAIPFSRGSSPNPGIETRSPALQVDSLPAEPPGKPKKTGVGSLSLLQQIFLTQELNWGLLHCRQILYQLSYQGSPGPCWLSILNTLVCICQSQTPMNPSPIPFPPGNHKFVSKSMSLFLFCK